MNSAPVKSCIRHSYFVRTLFSLMIYLNTVIVYGNINKRMLQARRRLNASESIDCGCSWSTVSSSFRL